MRSLINKDLQSQRMAIRGAAAADEGQIAQGLIDRWASSQVNVLQVTALTQAIVSRARSRKSERGLLELFLQQFGLSTNEGVALLSLSEALLRVPDHARADDLIAEKFLVGHWERRSEQSDSSFVNRATRALDSQLGGQSKGSIRSVISRLGEPVVRTSLRQAMGRIGDEFVFGRTIEEALRRVAKQEAIASFDMLSEGARTAVAAQRNFSAYQHAIATTAVASRGGLHAGHGVSVKLSALHPRYEHTSSTRVMSELLPRVKRLAMLARAGSLHLIIDAEEAARLEPSLDVIEALARDPELADWQGLGFALQCYSKRALAVLDWLVELGARTQRRLLVRLVKGAYWNSEIKRAQELGLATYPVFTRKASTDLSYLVCAAKALAHPKAIYPQFATHNAHTICAVLELAGVRRDFEFLRLHGMGELLYSAARQVIPDLPPVRIYAPVGAHRDLLAYLVRRLLEHSPNSSLVNQLMDEAVPLARLAQDPLAKMRSLPTVANPKIVLPGALYGAARRNSRGIDLSDPSQSESLLQSLQSLQSRCWRAAPLISGASVSADSTLVFSPANAEDVVGEVTEASRHQMNEAIDAAVGAQPDWDRGGVERRAQILERAAELFENEREQYLSLLVREAGKTVLDAISEVREAVDFCRYYAAQAREQFAEGKPLVGPTGESNVYSLRGRGAFVCISPWNFPLAIFVGQVTAALAAGNSVLAKPAEQTPLIAAAATHLLHRAGVPVRVLHFLPGRGEIIGAALVRDERIAGVVMTGSLSTAKSIAQSLAHRLGAIIPLIAETGGQNAMFVDSTALPEQVVDDVIRSAFHSAGQRCSALRVLYLQEEVADGIIAMLKGAMDELKVGNPAELCTDVGPVIDESAREQLTAHISLLKAAGCLLHASSAGEDCGRGFFVPPHLFAIPSVKMLKNENFGPLLHVVRYCVQDLDRHLSELNVTGSALTLGVQSRIEARARQIFGASRAGSVYVNRNMIGALVGVQPFGGHGLSGTGPKAGGPLYLQRMATERVLSINTAASGGDVALPRTQSKD